MIFPQLSSNIALQNRTKLGGGEGKIIGKEPESNEMGDSMHKLKERQVSLGGA